MSRRVADQPDLFAPAPNVEAGSWADTLDEPPDEAFLRRIRDELNGHLARARATTEGFPWRDLTETYLVELRVNSMSRWLPCSATINLRILRQSG